MGRSGGRLAWCFLTLAFLALLPACQGSPRTASPTAATPATTTLATPTTPATVTAACREPERRTIAPYFAPAAGATPLWAVTGLGMVTGPPPVPAGWKQKVLWVVAPEQGEALTLSGRNLADGTPLWFEIGGDAPATSVVLDPRHPGIPIQHGDWREWPSYLDVPKAGCYELTARWPGGTWHLTFPATGEQPSPRPALSGTPPLTKAPSPTFPHAFIPGDEYASPVPRTSVRGTAARRTLPSTPPPARCYTGCRHEPRPRRQEEVAR